MKSVFGFRVRLGNPDLDFENLNPDFPIERTHSSIPVYFSFFCVTILNLGKEKFSYKRLDRPSRLKICVDDHDNAIDSARF